MNTLDAPTIKVIHPITCAITLWRGFPKLASTIPRTICAASGPAARAICASNAFSTAVYGCSVPVKPSTAPTIAVVMISSGAMANIVEYEIAAARRGALSAFQADAASLNIAKSTRFGTTPLYPLRKRDIVLTSQIFAALGFCGQRRSAFDSGSRRAAAIAGGDGSDDDDCYDDDADDDPSPWH